MCHLVYFLTAGVDEVTKDSQGAHPASLITVLQLLKNKHDQPVWEGVRWRERSGEDRREKDIKNSHRIAENEGQTTGKTSGTREKGREVAHLPQLI